MLKIKVKLEVYGVFLDEDKFLQTLALNPSFDGAVTVLKRLLPREYQDYDSVDTESLDEDDMYDMFYMSGEEHESSLVATAKDGAPSSRRISLAKTFRNMESRRLSQTTYSGRTSLTGYLVLGEKYDESAFMDRENIEPPSSEESSILSRL